MNTPTAYHQLGQFIVTFQHLETAVNDLLVLIADTDEGVVRILANDLDYSKRLNTTDVLFARFVDLRNGTRQETKREFHELMVELKELGELRNDFVHSRYNPWFDVCGTEGLLRNNSKLRGSRGLLEEKEEELQSQTFHPHLQRLATAATELERFRLMVID